MSAEGGSDDVDGSGDEDVQMISAPAAGATTSTRKRPVRVASTKRKVQVNDDDDDDGDVGDATMSSSDDAHVDDDADDDDEDEDEYMNEEERKKKRRKKPATAKRTKRKAAPPPSSSSFAAAKKPAAAAASSSSSSAKRARSSASARDGGGVPSLYDTNLKEAERGILLSVELRNFLCHRRLTIHFGPHINFVHGQNGSGKSAILVAIQTCLGSKASDTNRGHTLKNLITDGESVASVTVTIKNEGSEAYEPDRYGDRIIVERRITSSGSSTYRIMNDEGKKVSDKRSELGNILDCFGIQVNNPCAILNQDTSREFLQAKGKNSEQQKYAFFEKATLLDAIKNNVEATTYNVDSMGMAIDEGRKKLEAAKSDLCEAAEEKAESEKIDGMRKQHKALQKRVAWLLVSEMEVEMEVLREKLMVLDGKKVRLADKLAEQESDDLSSRKEELLNRVSSSETDISAHGVVMERMKRREREYTLRGSKAKQARQRAQRQASDNVKQLKAKRVQLASFEQEAERDRNQEMTDYENKMTALRARLGELESQMKALEVEADNCDEQRHQSEQSVRGAMGELCDRERASKGAVARIEHLKQAQKDTNFLFGKHSVAILAEIRKHENLFHHQPLGPLGAFIRVNEERFATPVQAAVKTYNLDSFVAHDLHDRAELAKIMRRVCRGGRDVPSIFVQRYSEEVYPDLARARHPKWPTVFDSVTFQSNWVARVLIDQRSIEGFVLVIDTDRNADNVAFNFVLKSRNDRTVRGAVAMDGRVAECKGAGSAHWRPAFNGRAVLSADVSRELEAAKATLAPFREEEVKAGRRVESLKHEANDFKMQLLKIRDKVKALSMAIQRVTRDMERAENERPQEPDMGERDELLEEIAGLEAQTEELKGELEQRDSEFTVVRDEIVAFKDELDAGEEKFSVLKQQLKDANSELKRFTDSFAKRKVQVDKTRGQLATVEKEIERVIQVQTEASRDLDDKRKLTSDTFGPLDDSIRPNEKASALNRDLKRVAATVAALESAMGRTAAEIVSRFLLASSEWDRVKGEMSNLLTNQKKLRDAANLRQHELEAFRMALAANAATFFNMYLSQQGHSGKLTFDHVHKSIQLEVTTYTNSADTDASKKRTTKDTKSLSGGERSSSTLAFIMALSEAMDTPFRAMDEFDIFMDTLNRKNSMDTLVKAAKGTPHRQFIFITPLGSQSVQPDKNIKIFELQPPERTQAVINFQ